MAGSEVAVARVPDSVPALLDWLTAEGFELRANGDGLRVEPVERVTLELPDRLVQHKAEILEALSLVNRYVTLKGGLTVPEPALQLN